MGSWNESCAVTGLAVNDGDDCVTWLAHQIYGDYGHLHQKGWLSPCSLPMKTTYRDYGRFDIEPGHCLDYSIEQLKKHLVEIPEGTNKYHDIPVTRELITPEFIWKAIHEKRLYVEISKSFQAIIDRSDHRDNTEQFQPHQRLVWPIHVLREVWDEILEVPMYNWGKMTHAQYLEECKEKFDATFADVLSTRENLEMDDDTRDRIKMLAAHMGIHEVDYIFREGYETGVAFEKGLMNFANTDMFWTHFDELLKASTLVGYHARMGKQLAYGGHVGQEDNIDGVRIHIGIVERAAARLEKRFEEY